MVGAAVAPAENIDLMRLQIAHGNRGNLLFAGILPPAFQGSHGTSEGLGTKKNITRTFAAVNVVGKPPSELRINDPCGGSEPLLALD